MLGVYQKVVDGLGADEGVQPNDTLGLFAHRALEQVTWGLVVVWVGDDTCDQADDCEGVDLHVRMQGCNLMGFKSNIRVVLLIDV